MEKMNTCSYVLVIFLLLHLSFAVPVHIPSQKESRRALEQAGIKVEKDPRKLKSESIKRELDALFRDLKGSGYTTLRCAIWREVDVRRTWKCSLDGKVFSSEPECKDACRKFYACKRLSCQRVYACRKLRGGRVCEKNITRCDVAISLRIADGKSKVETVAKVRGPLYASLYAFSPPRPRPRTRYLDGLEASGGKIRWCMDRRCGAWIDPARAGITSAGGWRVETNSFRLRLCMGSSCGAWVSLGKHGVSRPAVSGSRAFRIESSPSGIRVCKRDGSPCGALIPLRRIYSYTCPFKGVCAEKRPGEAYCSPYPCRREGNTFYCMEKPTDLVSPVAGTWVCPDGTVFPDRSSCERGCQAFRCEKDKRVWKGDITCERNCTERGKCISG